jgi:hypothetical protein
VPSHAILLHALTIADKISRTVLKPHYRPVLRFLRTPSLTALLGSSLHTF